MAKATTRGKGAGKAKARTVPGSAKAQRAPAGRSANPAGPAAARVASPGGPAGAPVFRDGLEDMVRDLALLTAANNLMAQTAFLTVERLRISSEVVDEAVDSAFGGQLFDHCERLVAASDDLVLQLLDHVGTKDPRAALVRDLVRMRREFKDRAGTRPVEQRRLAEALERMYR